MFTKGVEKLDTAKLDSEKVESFIGASTDVEGKIDAKGTLRIEGVFRGKVHADFVILCESAMIRGDITAKRITVNGKVEGNLRAQEIVEIKANGSLLGEIYAPKFSMAEGGVFNGKIEMKTGEGKVLDYETNIEGSL
jgi:cytoskeletal protein CcmA (bactofilin family)